MSEAGYDLALTGFEEAEIQALLADAVESQEGGQEQDVDEPDAADDVPEAPAVPVSRTGDIWAIGPHRLICGDAADPAVVATLMRGEQARLCFTSPPYGNQRDYTSGGIGDWDALMRGVFAHLPMAGDGQVLVNLGLIHRDNDVMLYWNGWLDWMRTQGWRRFAWYQGPGMPGDWNGRLAPSLGRADYRRQYEPILYGWPEGARRHWCGDRDQGDVWQIKKPARNDLHPTMKPVELVERAIRNSSRPGNLIFDAFGGSGTTLIAAEKSGRRARLMELDPKYVDAIVHRWQDWTGEQATRESDGAAFDDLVKDAAGI